MGDVSLESQYDAGIDAQHAQYAVTSRSGAARVLLGTGAVLFFVLFVALGTWQLERRVWKLDLIARVEQRVHAPPVAAPGPAQWPLVSAARDEYRHVTATGTFVNAAQTFVQATTELGAGYWVLTPLRTTDAGMVLVNRGFIPASDRDKVQPGSKDPVQVTGLLRVTEPGGAFLRHNDPAANRWYSRDVQAIARARGLSHVAPYFIDAEASPQTSERPSSGQAQQVAPVAGLTVLSFHNSHLVYAITWYTLALMIAGGLWMGIRNEAHAH